MSTFDGIVPEFPDIRIDNFRGINGSKPPLACFLSHVHSDHLAGLESFRSPFVYCSAPTREILLRLERYPHRVNYGSGILESRQERYKHLKHVLKVIPLETPTPIELSPGNTIRVTLFDANHCVGSVMFLIENDRYAIVYTGDIRSEPWFVNTLARHPVMIEYANGLRVLDTIYLDTSHLDPVHFPTKAEGLNELLHKIRRYPPTTKFHFRAYTFGYEDVWILLSKALQSPIHLDSYKLRLYRSLRADNPTSSTTLGQQGPALIGYRCANADLPGLLTDNESVRVHSCEKGSCTQIDGHIVWIRPIVRRDRLGREVLECDDGAEDGQGISSTRGARAQHPQEARGLAGKRPEDAQNLPRMISFAYARHSSYFELIDLVARFRPRDVYPCTVRGEQWQRGDTIKTLFGDACSGTSFRHDEEMKQKCEALRHQQNDSESSSQSQAPCANLETCGDTAIIETATNGFATPRATLKTLSSPISPATARQSSISLLSTTHSSQSTSNDRHGPTSPETSHQLSNASDVDTGYYDTQDHIYRCVLCGWELWTPRGNCSQCGAGRIPYFEVIQPQHSDLDHRFGVVPSEEWSSDDVDSQQRISLAGDYLDIQSAYSSSHDIENDYEMDSFIDDTSIDSQALDCAPPSNIDDHEHTTLCSESFLSDDSVKFQEEVTELVENYQILGGDDELLDLDYSSEGAAPTLSEQRH